MAESIADRGEPLIDFDRALLAGKTEILMPRRDAVSRRDLIDSARGSGRRVVAITAPAGYGKSTMLGEWGAIEDRVVAWATIDRFDDHPAGLLSVLASATAHVSASGMRLVPEMRGTGAAALARSAPLLAQSWGAATAPFTLFVDDLHFASSADCHDALEIVLAGVPEGSQVVIASRHDSEFLARMRAAGAVFDVTQEDLKLDVEGARAVFRAAGVGVTDDVAASAVERCEGWPTGVFLCALSASDGVRTEIVGDDRLVADYLYRECLAGLASEAQDFLRQTAILEQLSGPLCDAVRQANDSQQMLRLLDSLNLFLIPLDRRRRWFRYHALFRDFLIGELGRVSPGMIPELHIRAADWFESHDAPRRAVEHLLAADERGRAQLLIARLAMPVHQAGEVEVVSRWLTQLGERSILTLPPLAALAAWLHVLDGKSPSSERWAAALDRVELTRARPDVRIEFESSRDLLRATMCIDGPQRMLEEAEPALAKLPEWSVWRTVAHNVVGVARLLLGDTRAGHHALTQSSESAMRMGNSSALVLSEADLAILAADRGKLRSAGDHIESALQTIDVNRMDEYAAAALAFGAAARIAALNRNSERATRLLARGMRARVHCTHVIPWLAVRARLQMAITYQTLGDKTAAQLLLNEIDALLHRRPLLGILVDQVDSFRTTLARTTARGETFPLTPAELRLLPYLQTHLTAAEIADRLFISKNTVSSHLASTYRKLGATTRSTAVERALEIGLLGE
ncbi:LuxR C-terminal-related transcriptional regulator [Microbacterium sp. AZCO]|uniref:LuxR C-terminal-related transcriptional regulator n=1 Tax=Microbacterium sp. AZCO TaxID=3142976 RepID=UPI0031F38307